MSVPDLTAIAFSPAVVIPVAQVTVVDADEGDANLVDFCRLPIPAATAPAPVKVDFSNDGWYRTLIDTGPSNGNIVSSLKRIAGGLNLPRLNGGVATSCKLHALQITHPDSDHVGNASDFLAAMMSTATTPNSATARYCDRLKFCKITYCPIPSTKPDPMPQVKAGAPVYSLTDKGEEVNTVTFQVDPIDPGWVEKLRIAGITPITTRLRSVTYDPVKKIWVEPKYDPSAWTKNGFKWQWTLEPNSPATITYKDFVPKDPVKKIVNLKVDIQLHYAGDRNVEAKKAMKSGQATFSISEIKSKLAGNLPQVVLSDKAKLQLQTMTPFTLTWIGNKKLKSNPKVSVGGPSGMMANMAINQPLTGNPVAESEGGSFVIRSVPEVQSLTAQIVTLNKRTYKTIPTGSGVAKDTTLSLKSGYPQAGDISKAQSDAAGVYGYHRILGPTEVLYGNMMREMLLLLYEYTGNQKQGTIKLPSESTNRASVVTLFERPALDPSGVDASFTMLFTGDAFDKGCDIRDTLLSWNRGQQAPAAVSMTMNVDVLKIPHHGSDVSQSSGFYSFVRANVYLVCGSHHNKHGNPKLSSLKAIIRGFADKTAPGGAPFRIFFSSPLANSDYSSDSKKTTWRSPVKAILADDELKPGIITAGTGAKPKYYYRMYKVNYDSIKNASYAAYGTIGFGKNAAGLLVTEWNAAQWVNISGTGVGDT